MNLSVSVTLVFGCVLFYASLLLYLKLRRTGHDEGSAAQQRGRGDA
jgi:uncharacterized membrane protein